MHTSMSCALKENAMATGEGAEPSWTGSDDRSSIGRCGRWRGRANPSSPPDSRTARL